MPAEIRFNDAVLARHNLCWGLRHENWLRHAIPPWWAEDVIVTPEMRFVYEAWLPIEDFRASLRRIFRTAFPEDWLPLPLRSWHHPSLPDLWAALPSQFAPRLCFEQQELLPLFCTLADPPRFGTIPGRYPEQVELLKTFAGAQKILDVACGVGLNTLEIAEAMPNAQVSGISIEPLEIWMANKRLLPHDALRQKMMDRYAACQAAFQVGDAQCFNLSADLIVCNGLVGGRFFHASSQYQGFLESCRRSLLPGGHILLANKFHEGSRQDVLAFCDCARRLGFAVSGSWQNLMLD